MNGGIKMVLNIIWQSSKVSIFWHIFETRPLESIQPYQTFLGTCPGYCVFGAPNNDKSYNGIYSSTNTIYNEQNEYEHITKERYLFIGTLGNECDGFSSDATDIMNSFNTEYCWCLDFVDSLYSEWCEIFTPIVNTNITAEEAPYPWYNENGKVYDAFDVDILVDGVECDDAMSLDFSLFIILFCFLGSLLF